MTSSDEKIRRGLHALGEDIAVGATARVRAGAALKASLQSSSPAQRPRMRLVLTALGGAAAATAVLAALNVGGVLGGSDNSARVGADSSRLTQVPPNNAFNGIPVAPVGTPCDGATKLPLVGLLSLLPSKVWIPANDAARVTDAWTCGKVPVLMLGDVQASYEPGWSDVPVDSKLNDLAADLGGTVTKINGLSVLVAPANQSHTNNEVLMVIGDTAVKLLSAGDVPIDVLTNDVRAINPLRPTN